MLSRREPDDQAVGVVGDLWQASRDMSCTLSANSGTAASAAPSLLGHGSSARKSGLSAGMTAFGEWVRQAISAPPDFRSPAPQGVATKRGFAH